MNSRRIIAILIWWMGLRAAAFSADAYSAAAGAFLRMGLGARAIAMGNSGVAEAQDGLALYYNPAAIPYQTQKHFVLSYRFLPFDRLFYFTGLTFPVRPTAGVGIGWLHAGVKNIEGRNSAGYIDEVYSTGEDALVLAFANAIHPRLSFGINFKILRQELVDLVATGVGFDCGILYLPHEQLRLGIQFQDIGAGYTWNTQKLFDKEGSNYRETFPQRLKLGIAFRPQKWLSCSSDLEFFTWDERRYHAGLEYNYHDLAYLRMGFDGSSLTCGGGLTYGFILGTDTQLDYCFAWGAAGEGPSHIFTWQIKF